MGVSKRYGKESPNYCRVEGHRNPQCVKNQMESRAENEMKAML